MTLLNAVNWTVYAWNNFVKLSTIVNYFYKSTLIQKPTLGRDLNAHSEINQE